MNRKIAYQNLLQIDNLSYLMFQNSTLKRNDENLFVLYIGEKKDLHTPSSGHFLSDQNLMAAMICRPQVT